MKEILPRLGEWFSQSDEALALAVVVDVEGSAMRPKGAVMAIRRDGALAGSVSGGCIESSVLFDAETVYKTRTPAFRTFSHQDDEILGSMSPCGGDVRIAVGLLNKTLYGSLVRLVADRLGGRWGMITDGPPALTGGFFAVDGNGTLLPGSVEFDGDTTGSGLRRIGELEVFTAELHPSPRLFVIGATHLGVRLSVLSTAMGYLTTVVDPRTAFARPERFAEGVELRAEWPRKVLVPEILDRDSAVAALSHDPKIDDQALGLALAGECFYVGALGSATTQGRIRARLEAAGTNAADLDRIHGPIGLGIGAANPEEISLAIMAEIVSEYRSRYGKSRDF